MRDVEATLSDVLGAEAALSKSTVSRVCQAIKDEFDTWETRDLGEASLEYLFLDGSHFRMRDGARAAPVLAAWEITSEGRPALVGLDSAASESTDAWQGFLDGLVTRGLRAPLLMVSDAAPGLISGVEVVFPSSLRQRCAIHRCRNVLAKGPVEHQAEVKVAYWAIFDPTGEVPGEKSIAVARKRAVKFSATFGRRFPSAVTCFDEDLTSLFSYLRFPTEHHKRIRHSNFIERTFDETRRRVKVIGRLLAGAVVPVAGVGGAGPGQPGMARGDTTPVSVRHLQELRRQLPDRETEKPATAKSTKAVTAAA